VDRVVREGTTFERAEDGGFRGLTRLRAALLVTTANAPYDEATGDGLDRFWRELVLPTCGVARVERLHLTPVVTSTLAVRRGWLEEVAERAEATFAAS
jgi:putative NADPH-quinone reductase